MAGVTRMNGSQTMPDLLIRGIDPEVLARLKDQAARHGRSMQAEAKAIVETGVKPTMDEWLERVDSTRTALEARRGVYSDSSAELVREARAEREGRLSSGG